MLITCAKSTTPTTTKRRRRMWVLGRWGHWQGLETQMRFKFNPRYVFFSLCFLTLLIMLHCSFTNDFTLLLLYAKVATTRNSMGTGTHYYRRRPQVRFFISFYIFFDYTNDVHLLVYYAVTVVPNSRDEEKQLGWSFWPRTGEGNCSRRRRVR